MTKKEALKQLYEVREILVDTYITYNDMTPDNTEKMRIDKCISKLSNVIQTYYKN